MSINIINKKYKYLNITESGLLSKTSFVVVGYGDATRWDGHADRSAAAIRFGWGGAGNKLWASAIHTHTFCWTLRVRSSRLWPSVRVEESPPPLLFAAVQVRPSVVDFPGNLHIHPAVVHHVHGPLLQDGGDKDGGDKDGGNTLSSALDLVSKNVLLIFKSGGRRARLPSSKIRRLVRRH